MKYNSVNKKSANRKGHEKKYKLKFYKWNCVCITILGENEIKIFSICIFFSPLLVVAPLHRSLFSCVYADMHALNNLFMNEQKKIDRVCGRLNQSGFA